METLYRPLFARYPVPNGVVDRRWSHGRHGRERLVPGLELDPGGSADAAFLDGAGFGESHSSELMTRFTYDVEAVAGGVQTLLGRTVLEPLKMIVCLVGAALICWRLLLVSLLIAPLTAFLVRRLAQTLKRANRRAMEEMSQLYTILQETFGGIKVVKAFTMERHERRRLHYNSKKFYSRAMKIARYD